MKPNNKTDNTKSSHISSRKPASSEPCPDGSPLSPELSELIEAASKLPAGHIDLLVEPARRIAPE